MAYIVTVGQVIDYINTHKTAAEKAKVVAAITASRCLHDDDDDLNEVVYEESVNEYIKEMELVQEAEKLIA